MCELQQALFDAIEANDLPAVKRCIENGADPNLCDNDNMPLLHWAVLCRSSPKIIAYLVEQGVNINYKNCCGDTAIHYCTQLPYDFGPYVKPSLEVLDCLLRLGCDVNDINHGGKTLLCEAVKYEDIETTKFLLEHGADVNVEFIPSYSSDPITAKSLLHVAIGDLLYDLADILIEYGADIHVRDRENRDLLRLLVEIIPCGRLARCHEYKNIYRCLPEDCLKPFDKFIRKLISMGIDINEKDLDGKTVLDIATYPKVREILIAAGAKSGQALFYDELQQALFKAVCENDLEAVKHYVEQGADVNGRGDCPCCLETPLHFAVHSSIDIIKYLVSEGADVNAEDLDRKTPLHYAVSANNVEHLKYLVSVGDGVNAKDEYGRTLLHHAVEEESFEVVKCLVSLGADVNAKDNSAKTPLHVAATKSSVEILKYLVSHGADINAKDNDGKTALDIATYSKIKRHSKIKRIRRRSKIGK